MDKHILLVKSDIETTRSLKNKNLVSFHKRFSCCFNRTVFEEIGIKPGMYANFSSVDYEARRIYIIVRNDRPTSFKSKWYKITNPQVSKYNSYCYIRTTNLTYDYDMLPLGAFEYAYDVVDIEHIDKTIVIAIKY